MSTCSVKTVTRLNVSKQERKENIQSILTTSLNKKKKKKKEKEKKQHPP